MAIVPAPVLNFITELRLLICILNSGSGQNAQLRFRSPGLRVFSQEFWT